MSEFVAITVVIPFKICSLVKWVDTQTHTHTPVLKYEVKYPILLIT